MGSLYGIETGRFELLQLVLSIAGEYGLPFRFPGTFTDAQMSNTMLDIKSTRSRSWVSSVSSTPMRTASA